MADQRITELTPITGAQLADNDPFVVVDRSDTSMSPTGTNKRLEVGQLKNRLTLDNFLKGSGATGQVGVFNASGEVIGQPALLYDGNDLQVGSMRIVGNATPTLGGDAVTLDYLNANTIPDAPADDWEYLRRNNNWVRNSAVSVSELPYRFSTGSSSTPAAGRVTANTGDLSFTTFLYINRFDDNNIDRSLALVSLGNDNGIVLQYTTSAGDFVFFVLTGDPVQNGDVFEIPVTWTGGLTAIANNQALLVGLIYSGAGSGGGDVVGPNSATDNAIVRFDTTSGKLVQDSTVTIDDSGNLNMGDGDIQNAGIVHSSILEVTPQNLAALGVGGPNAGFGYDNVFDVFGVRRPGEAFTSFLAENPAKNDLLMAGFGISGANAVAYNDRTGDGNIWDTFEWDGGGGTAVYQGDFVIGSDNGSVIRGAIPRDGVIDLDLHLITKGYADANYSGGGFQNPATESLNMNNFAITGLNQILWQDRSNKGTVWLTIESLGAFYGGDLVFEAGQVRAAIAWDNVIDQDLHLITKKYADENYSGGGGQLSFNRLNPDFTFGLVIMGSIPAPGPGKAIIVDTIVREARNVVCTSSINMEVQYTGNIQNVVSSAIGFNGDTVRYNVAPGEYNGVEEIENKEVRVVLQNGTAETTSGNYTVTLTYRIIDFNI